MAQDDALFDRMVQQPLDVHVDGEEPSAGVIAALDLLGGLDEVRRRITPTHASSSLVA